jgi:hypothetical protein
LRRTQQEERVQQEREASIQDGKESSCIGQHEDIEFVGIVRKGEKEKGSAPERSHSVEEAQPERATPATARGAEPKLKRALHGAAAHTTISQILADKESDDEVSLRLHSASPDESPPSMRLQAPRWGMSSWLQNTTPNASLQTPITQSSLPFTCSAFGAHSTSFPAPSTKASVPVLRGSPVLTGVGPFAEPGTLALKGFTSVQAPSSGPATELGGPITDGDTS